MPLRVSAGRAKAADDTRVCVCYPEASRPVADIPGTSIHASDRQVPLRALQESIR